ncbi:mucin-5AC isoform X2 [Octopus bimaculoides]|uniref:C2H2-type domain-containing protein n=1 Tax=Octopus bimaculoides TaxID=37653 RepID=A0A0L8HBM1_OCTBM|nr:mucin-5AC isoform X2 [Octopus bimaculoides]|eukprot:XP_014773831.1 PREDICTED: mucin-5AC-like isoform X2 [Octopus bimaculoides]
MALAPSYQYFPRTFSPKVLIHSKEPCTNIKSQHFSSLGSFPSFQILKSLAETSRITALEAALETTKFPTPVPITTTAQLTAKTTEATTTTESPTSPLLSPSLLLSPTTVKTKITTSTTAATSRTSTATTYLKTATIYTITTATAATTTTTTTTNTKTAATISSSSSVSASSSPPALSSTVTSSLIPKTIPKQATISPTSSMPVKMTQTSDQNISNSAERDKQKTYCHASADILQPVVLQDKQSEAYFGAFSAFGKADDKQTSHNGLLISQIDASFKCLYCCGGPSAPTGINKCQNDDMVMLEVAKSNILEKHLLSNRNHSWFGGDRRYGHEQTNGVYYPTEWCDNMLLKHHPVMDFTPCVQFKDEPHLVENSSPLTLSLSSSPCSATSLTAASSTSTSSLSLSLSPPLPLPLSLPPLPASSLSPPSFLLPRSAAFPPSSSLTPSPSPSSLSPSSSTAAALFTTTFSSSPTSLLSSSPSSFSSSFSLSSSSVSSSSLPYTGYHFHHSQQDDHDPTESNTQPQIAPSAHLPRILSVPLTTGIRDNPPSSQISLQPPLHLSSFQYQPPSPPAHPQPSLPPQLQIPLSPSPSSQPSNTTTIKTSSLSQYRPPQAPAPPPSSMCFYRRQSLVHYNRRPFLNGHTSSLAKLKIKRGNYLKRNDYSKGVAAFGRLNFSTTAGGIGSTTQNGCYAQRSTDVIYKVPSQHQQPYIERRQVQRTRNFHCPYCVISCSNRGQLQGHIRIHTVANWQNR